MKFCAKCSEEIDTKDGENLCAKCEAGKTKKAKANRQRRERHEALNSLGLVRVRGAMGGVYYE